MIIWMGHEKHGFMPCYDVFTVERNKENGWVEVAPPENGKPLRMPGIGEPVTTLVRQDEPTASKTLAQRYAEKFGKPPHHRMKQETIEKALTE